jgi:hypothetical protein
VAKDKPDNERINDAGKLDAEMAEGKSPEVVAAIYREGDKYYCAECLSELPMRQPCPKCHKEVDWDRFLSETRQY